MIVLAVSLPSNYLLLVNLTYIFTCFIGLLFFCSTSFLSKQNNSCEDSNGAEFKRDFMETVLKLINVNISLNFTIIYVLLNLILYMLTFIEKL